MMNFYCSEKHDKTNRFDSDWGTRKNKIEHNKAAAVEDQGPICRPIYQGLVHLVRLSWGVSDDEFLLF
jgi:hypothetical protein